MKTTKLLIALAIFLSQYAYAQTPDFTESFTTTWKTTTSGDSITIPTKGGSDVTDYNFWIDWGDGTEPENAMGDDPNPPHTYDTAGTFTVQITGTFPHFYLNNAVAIKAKLLSVEQWGNIAWESMARMFHGASNLTLNDTDTPILSGVTDMSRMFQSASAFNQDISGWNVSSVTNMGYMFFNATAFNQDISGWNVSSVTDMRTMFGTAFVFNQDIGGWNVSNVENMDVMFNNAYAFDQDIGEWNVGSVSDMSFMFSSARAFNQDIGDWNVDSVTNMAEMFNNAPAFNQDISGWNVSSVTDMASMFSGARAFNQDIGEWKVDSVMNMLSMFWNATAFNQDLSGWNVSKVTNMTGMLNNSGLSTYHYEELLIAWNKLELEENVPLGAAGRQYRARAQTARDSLEDTRSWMITGDGMKAENDAPTLTAPLPDTVLITGFPSYKIPIATLFTDPEGDAFELTFTTGGDMAIEVALANDMLTLTEMGLGVDSIIITATDEFSAQAADTFYISVVSFDSAFTTTWKTDASYESIGIPINKAGEDPTVLSAYDFYVDWGDDSPIERIIGADDPDSSHVYAAPGTYQIKITGTYPAFRLAGNPKGSNLVSVDQWGNIAWESMDLAFLGADTLMIRATDLPNLSGVTVMKSMFRELAVLNGNMSHWNVSNVENMSYMFLRVPSFNENISNWDVSKVTTMANMLKGSGLSTYHYEELLIAWDKLDLRKDVFLGATGIQYRARAKVAHDSLASPTDHRWTIRDSGLKDENDEPVITAPLPDSLLFESFGSFQIPIATLFTDADGDPLTLSIATQGDMAITAVLGKDSLALTEAGLGVDTISISANDGMVQVSDTFIVTIQRNDPPILSLPIADITPMEALDSLKIYIANVFTDDQPLMFSVDIDPDDLVGGVIEDDSLVLRFTDASPPDITVILTASDGAKHAKDTFTVTFFPGAFVTRWKTTTPSEIIRMYTQGGDDFTDFDFQINWGDKTPSEDFAGDALFIPHTYVTPGTYKVYIMGTFPNVTFERSYLGYVGNILSVERWGDIEWESMSKMFAGAGNMVLNATDTPDLSSVTDMSYMFFGAASLNQNIGDWNVSNVTNMQSMFAGGASSFNQDLNDWNVSNVTNMAAMFGSASNFNQDLNDWNVSQVTNMELMFHRATAFNQDLNGWNVSSVKNMQAMFENAALFNGDISSWNTSSVTKMGNMFISADSFDGDMSGWDVSNVESMDYMFYETRAFTGMGINSWNVSSVKDMRFMFALTDDFNGDIGDWNVSNVDTMHFMFWKASAFNQDIGRWDVGNVTTLRGMFFGSSMFNADLSRWNVSRVKNMRAMFHNAQSFTGQGLGAWKVDSVTNMSNMFSRSFTGRDLVDVEVDSLPEIGSETNINDMFSSPHPFNQDLSSWNVSSVTDMKLMFTHSLFEGRGIEHWNVAKVTDMHGMFGYTTKFNGDISRWNVDSVTDMSSMFQNAVSFNRDLSKWNPVSVTDFANFLDSTSLSIYNYEQLLISWADRELQNGLTIHISDYSSMAGLKYRERAKEAHDSLTSYDQS